MFRWLKKHFIPHDANNHRPHFLYRSNVRKIILVVLVLEVLLFIFPSILLFRNFDLVANILPAVLNNLTNEERLAANLPELETSPVLVQAAKMKAEDMASKGYFAHNSPEGLTPWYWLEKVGFKYAMAGENLAINFADSQDVTKAWMNSPSHRDNILKRGFTQIGTAATLGIYQGQETVFIVQYYAKSAFPELPTPAISDDGNSLGLMPTDLSIQDSQLTAVLGEAVASPKNTLNITLLVLLGIVFLALIINLFTGVHLRHPDLMTNGLIFLIIILGIYLANKHLLEIKPLLNSEVAFVSDLISN